MFLAKILIIGDSGVGKSSLLLRYADNSFYSEYISTIGVDYRIKSLQLEHDGRKKTVKLQIWDSAGQEKFRNIVQAYYRGAQGIMMVYDVTNKESFDSIEAWLRESNLNAGNDVVNILIGTKIDCQNRAVSTEEGKALADKLGLKYVETSAQSGTNVEQAFTELAQEILEKLSSQQTGRKDAVIRTTYEDGSAKKGAGCCK